MKLNRYYAAGIAAFVLWGFIPFPLRELGSYGSGQILYFRVVVSVLILLFVSLVFRRNNLRKTYLEYREAAKPEQNRFLVFTFIGGLLLTSNWLMFIYVVNNIDIQTGSFAYLLCPIITALLGFIILKEKLAVNQWIAIGLSMVSCSLIATGALMHLFFSILVASTYAFYLISQRIVKQYDRITLLTLQLLIATLLIAPFYTYFKGTATKELDLHFFAVITALSAFFTVLPLFLNLFSLKELTSGTVGVLMYINPIMNFFIAFLYFGEQFTPLKVVAYSIIFFSIILYNLNFKKKAVPERIEVPKREKVTA